MSLITLFYGVMLNKNSLFSPSLIIPDHPLVTIYSSSFHVLFVVTNLNEMHTQQLDINFVFDRNSCWMKWWSNVTWSLSIQLSTHHLLCHQRMGHPDDRNQTIVIPYVPLIHSKFIQLIQIIHPCGTSFLCWSQWRTLLGIDKRSFLCLFSLQIS